MLNPKLFNWLVYGFLSVIVAIVFQQIHTSMTEQGIASGGPYNNGAAYPRAIAIAIVILVIGQIVVERFKLGTAQREDPPVELSDLRRPALLLVVFGVYLGLLNYLGYHLTTTPLVFAIMWICGARNVLKLLLVALLMSFSLAFIFEKFLSVVLPGGIFALNIPW